MAAIDNPTNSSAVEELIESEVIQAALLADAHRPAAVFESVCFLHDASGQPSATFALPQWTSDTVTTGKTETDEFAYVEQDTTESTVTVATTGIRKGVSFEAIDDATIDLVAGVLRNSMLDVLDQMDTDALSSITSASNTEDHSGVDLTRAHIIEAMATLAGNDAHAGMPCGVFHSRQIADLRTSLNSAGDQLVVAQQANDLFQYGRQGYVGRWMGIDFFESNNVPQFDANNWSGALLMKGAMSPLVLSVKKPRTPMFEEHAARLVLDVVVYARYGTTLHLDSNIVEVVSSKT